MGDRGVNLIPINRIIVKPRFVGHDGQHFFVSLEIFVTNMFRKSRFFHKSKYRISGSQNTIGNFDLVFFLMISTGSYD